MKKWQFAVVALVFMSSQVTFASRFGDAWKGSKSRIHGRFSKKGNSGGGAMTLLMTSSTTISSLSSTALTSGGDMLKEVAYRDEFINENLYAIKLDSAKGQGEYLQTLAVLSGCEGQEAQRKFASQVRSHFDDVYDGKNDQDPGQIADQIDSMIQSNPEMNCRLIGMNLASK